MTVLKVVRDDSTDEPIERAKPLPRRPVSGVHRAVHDVVNIASGQGNHGADPAPGPVRSKGRHAARSTAANLLREVKEMMSMSSADLAALVDDKDTYVRDMLHPEGAKNWTALKFTLGAERSMRFGVCVILVFARYLRSLWGDAALDEIESGLRALRAEEVEPC